MACFRLRELRSDRATNLNVKLIMDVCKVLGIRKTTTCAYTPQSDGMAENTVKNVRGAINRYAIGDEEYWDNWLSMCLMPLRTSVQSSTKLSPWKLLYGREPFMLSDHILDLPPKENVKDYEQYAQEVLKHIQVVYKEAATNQIKASAQQAKQYNKNVSIVEFQPGDYVLYKKHVKTPGGICAKFIGPFGVVDVLENHNVVVLDQSGRRKQLRYSHIIPYKGEQETVKLHRLPVVPKLPWPESLHMKKQGTVPKPQPLVTKEPLRRSTRSRRAPDFYGDFEFY